MPDWINAYNISGVKKDINPSIIGMINKLRPSFIVCSDLKRSLHSAEIIGYPSPNLIDSLFREADLTHFKIPLIKFTPHTWSMIYRIPWLMGSSTNGESINEFKPRVHLATEKLISLAKRHNSVLFVGHGILNRFLAKELIAQGWAGKATPNNKYWGFKYWEYETYTK